MNNNPVRKPLSPFQSPHIRFFKASPLLSNITFFKSDITGPLDVDKFRQAVDFVVRRHETLRTTFKFSDNETYQCIWAAASSNLNVTDIHQMSNAQKNAAISAFVEEELNYRFDLEKSPPWRFNLVKIEREKYVFFVNINHVLMDYFSFGIIHYELMICYDFLVNGKSPLLETAVPHAEFVEWAIEMGRQNKDSYIDEQLAGNPVVSFRHPKESDLKFASPTANFHWKLTSDIVRDLRKISKSHHVGLLSLLESAFLVLWSKEIGESMGDFLYFTVVSGRFDEPKFKYVVGNYFSTLPLRISLNGLKDFIDIARAVHGLRQDGRKAALLRTSPFSLSKKKPLVTFNFLKLPYGSRFVAGNVTMEIDFVRPYATTPVSLPSELMFRIQELETGELLWHIVYSVTAFPEPQMISHLSRNLEILLKQVAQSPGSLNDLKIS